MSLVDRWLPRPVAIAGVATLATSATLPGKASISAGSDVANELRHSATSAQAATVSPIVSQPVAIELRQEKPQNSSRTGSLSQMSQMSQAVTSDAWDEAKEERAAIVQHHGNIPPVWAEGFARLDAARPPGDVPLQRWQRFVDDAGRFLDSPFCAVAAALGWGPFDLFGCDRDRPFARIDQAGLLWLLSGDSIVMLAEDAATLETRTGARQTYRRKPSEPGQVLAWDLQ